jgi:hypothetical protein
MNSPRYRPAGLLVERGRHRVMIDGGGAAVPRGPLDAWLVSDPRCELIAEIRRAARFLGLEPAVATYAARGLRLVPRRVEHTAHPTYGYLIEAVGRRVAWVPEFLRFPRWAAPADLAFADAAGWSRAIHFAKRVGGHASVFAVARSARRRGVRRLVFAHVGRPTIRALDRGNTPPWGEIGREGGRYLLARARRRSRFTGALRASPRNARRGAAAASPRRPRGEPSRAPG